MKKIFLILTFLLVNTVFSQTKTQNSNTNIEKSIIGIQTGFLGAWTYCEFKVIDKIVLRTELGLNSGFEKNGKISLTLAPEFTLEPRLYYNIDRRAAEGKKTTNNSANFFALTAVYKPDWFVISNDNNFNVPKQILIAPKWGIRRNITKHFNYELGVSIGISSYFGEKLGFGNTSTEPDALLHIRIGYDFQKK